MALSLRRSAADDLSAAFARAIEVGRPGAARRPAPRSVGIEHEFRVLDGDQVVDFRRLIHDLPIPGRRLDPADPNAYRGSWGGSITTDEREAEVAIAPEALEAGFAGRAAGAAVRGRSLVERALPDKLRLEGYSTHISVSMPDRLVETAARRFAETFGPALLLLMDGPASPGLLVRPRPGRLELGGEFVDGERLEAAVTFAAGAALAVERAVGSRFGWAGSRAGARRLPPAVALDEVPAVDRYGWLVRGAGGTDLHAEGRHARLGLARRWRGTGTMTAQEHLERAWAVARAALRGVAAPRDLQLVDRFVRGELPLGVELDQAAAIAQAPVGVAMGESADDIAAAGADKAADGPFGSVIGTRRRPGLIVEPSIVSWDFAVLRVTEDLGTVTGRTAFACLPRSALGPGLAALDGGHLDEILRAYLNLNADPRILAGAPQTRRPGLFGAVAAGGKLLAKELGPDMPGSDRPGKRQRDQPRDGQNPPADPPSTPPSVPAGAAPIAAGAAAAAFTIFGFPAAAAAAVAGVATVAIIGGAVFLGGGNPSSSPGASGTPGVGASATPANPGGPTGPFDGVIPVVFGSGSAEVSIVTDAGRSGSVSVPFIHGQIEPGGLLNITWGDGVYLPDTGGTASDQWYAMYGQVSADGSFNSDTGEVRFGVYLDSGEQLAIEPGRDHCLVDMRRTATDGIEGSYSCRESDDFFGLYQVEGTFWAEPDDGGTGPTSGPGSGGPAVFGSGSATLDVSTAAGTGTMSEGLEAGSIDADGIVLVGWGDGSFDAGAGGSIGGSRWLDIGGQLVGAGALLRVDGLDTDFSALLDTGDQISATATDEAICTVDMSRTPTGGIEGTISCTGVDQELGIFQAEGTYWAEPGSTGTGPDAGYVSGTASMHLTGEASGGATELLFAGEGEQGPADGELFPVVTWSDAGAINVLGLYTLKPHASGSLSTADGTLGVGWFVDQADYGGYVDWFVGGVGLGHEPGDPALGCSASIIETVTGGISGTISCPNVNDPSLVIGFEAEFTADYVPGPHYGDGDGTVISP